MEINLANKSEFLMLSEPARLMFPDLFDPQPTDDIPTPKFSAQFLLSTADAKAIWKLINKVAKDAFPDDADLCEMPLFDAEMNNQKVRYNTNPGLAHPLLQGDRIIERAEMRAAANSKDFDPDRMSHLAGKYVLQAKSGLDYPPRLAAMVNGHPVEYTPANRASASTYFYPGAEVIPGVSIASYQLKSGVMGVNCYLQSVFATGEGERMGGGASAIPQGAAQKYGRARSTPADDDDYTGTVDVQAAMKAKVAAAKRRNNDLDDDVSDIGR